jgi:hypothetical protein
VVEGCVEGTGFDEGGRGPRFGGEFAGMVSLTFLLGGME